jgi:hypothetical protein
MREIPEVYQERLAKWLKLYNRWIAIHYSLGLFAAIGAIVVATVGDKLPWHGAATILSIAVAAATITITFTKAQSEANGFIRAWRILDHACQMYKANPDYDVEKLADAVLKGEGIIGGTSNDPTNRDPKLLK